MNWTLVWHKYQLRPWQSEEGSIQYHGQDLLAEKTQSEKSLNDISSRNEVRASRYLTLKNNSRRTQDRQNLENFVLRERAVDKNGWKHYVYQGEECITWYLCSSNRDRVKPKWFCHHSTALSCMYAVNT